MLKKIQGYLFQEPVLPYPGKNLYKEGLQNCRIGNLYIFKKLPSALRISPWQPPSQEIDILYFISV